MSFDSFKKLNTFSTEKYLPTLRIGGRLSVESQEFKTWIELEQYNWDKNLAAQNDIYERGDNHFDVEVLKCLL